MLKPLVGLLALCATTNCLVTPLSSTLQTSNRSAWCDYDISTNYYDTVPDTGVIREYWFELIEATVSPDGYSRTALTVNGSIPGPMITADWGDTVKVHVTNSLTTNGTSIHFHGIRQNYTNPHDGVSSITQCPTPPGSNITYTWRATQYGTTWYHSHFALQAWEGVFGPIIINGPATANYDEDLGSLFLNDWSHETVDALYISAQTSGPPTLDNGLINGTNVYGDDDSDSQTGSRLEISVVSGTSYRLRLINGAIDTHFKFSIDNHTMTVIANDLVPIVPYNSTVLDVGIGERYDVIVTMDQASVATDFWLRAIPQIACSDNDSTDNIKAIVHYNDSSSTPTTTGYSYTDSCDDESLSDLVPYVSVDADSSYWSQNESVTVAFNSDNLFRWYMNNLSMDVEWTDPSLLQIYNDEDDWDSTSGVITLSEADEWAYIVIETENTVPHPIHLHGHDFLILSQASTSYSSSTTLSLTNPPRRDVAMLPGGGHLVLAFKTDNPGAWLMHCHIGWHTSEGFAIQFIERYDTLKDLIDGDALESNCAAWDTYQTAEDIVEDDSGV
ncbi:Cupredoxin [Delphinella strobiligena]|nr:Cupredoxin [Delphinella strobiligena]